MKKIKIATKILCFFLIVALIFVGSNDVLKVKYADGIYSMERFYQLEDNTVDLLVLGSSHAFESFNTSVFWEKGGVSSYVLAGSMQPMWNTYYYLKEALKTQLPKLIVLDGFSCVFEDDYNDYGRQIKNCYGMKFSLDKLRAMWVSSPLSGKKGKQEKKETVPKEEDDIGEGKELDFFFPFSNYSSRYRELTKADFLEYQGETKYKDWMGFASNYDHEAYETPQIKLNDDSLPQAGMTVKTEKYYRKLLQLAQERQIPMLVVITPYAAITEKDAAIFRSAEVIAKEYGAAFLNPALDPAACGLDFQLHAADISHFNAEGNRVFSAYFYDYIAEHYTFTDHRGDPKYAGWDRCSAYLKEADATQRLRNATTPKDISEELRGKNYRLFLLTGSGCQTEFLSELLNKQSEGSFEAGKVYDLSQSENVPIRDTSEITYKDIYLKFHSDLVRSDRSTVNTTFAAEADSAMIIVYDVVIDDVCDVINVLDREEPVIVHQ